jgi:hypothetical protein
VAGARTVYRCALIRDIDPSRFIEGGRRRISHWPEYTSRRHVEKFRGGWSWWEIIAPDNQSRRWFRGDTLRYRGLFIIYRALEWIPLSRISHRWFRLVWIYVFTRDAMPLCCPNIEFDLVGESRARRILQFRRCNVICDSIKQSRLRSSLVIRLFRITWLYCLCFIVFPHFARGRDFRKHEKPPFSIRSGGTVM